MPELDNDLADLGTAPISEAAPAGAAVRYEPEFERIENEIAKLEAVNGTPVDWRVVAEEGVAILRGKAKDMLVASFLCRGLFEVHGYPGLSAGLKIARDMTERYWDSLFPEGKRPRARAAAAGWLAERLVSPIEKRPPVASDRDAVEACLRDLTALGVFLDEKLARQAPSFGELRRGLEAQLQALPEPQPQTPASPPAQKPAAGGSVAAATPAPAAAPAPPAAPPGDIASDQDVQKGYRAGRDLLRNIAQYLRGKTPGSPASYVLVRQAAWLGIEQAPPDQDGVTGLREVAPERIAALDALAKAGNHADLIEQVETTLTRAPFWLDGHRLTATALEALSHDGAREAVVEALRSFLRRLPTLPDLRFANQTPFADELTRAWIQGEVLSSETGEGAAPAAAGGAENAAAPWLETAREAKKLATKGKMPAALGLLQAGQRQAASARERFLWALEQARLCHTAGRDDLAVPQLEHLDQQAARFQLEEWEPGLSLEIAALLLSCYKNQSSKNKAAPERAARMEQLQARIVRLDILAAVASPQK